MLETDWSLNNYIWRLSSLFQLLQFVVNKWMKVWTCLLYLRVDSPNKKSLISGSVESQFSPLKVGLAPIVVGDTKHNNEGNNGSNNIAARRIIGTSIRTYAEPFLTLIILYCTIFCRDIGVFQDSSFLAPRSLPCIPTWRCISAVFSAPTENPSAVCLKLYSRKGVPEILKINYFFTILTKL